jgi:hypothetical protein
VESPDHSLEHTDPPGEISAQNPALRRLVIADIYIYIYIWTESLEKSVDIFIIVVF